MQPLILIAVGYITGCIWGLYLNIDIASILFLCVFAFLKMNYKEIIKEHKWYIFIFLITVLISKLQVRIFKSQI